MINIDILSSEQMEALKSNIQGADHIIIVGHKSPDGDALGSSLGWAEYLSVEFGKKPLVIMPDAFPDFLQWLPNSEKTIRYDKHPQAVEKAFREADLIFCLDFNAYDRVDEMQTLLEQSPVKKILIDHHIAPVIDTLLSVSHEEMSSTCEIIFRIIYQMGGFERMNKNMAVPIYCGMMTDTGGFTYNSSRPEIFYIVSLLLTKRIDKDKIYRKVFDNYSQWAIRMRGYMMFSKLNVFEDFHATYYTISRKDMTDFHFIKGDAEGLVNIPLRIKGVKLSISLREDVVHDNLIWVSLRSVGNVSCNEIAKKFFNGGGHLNASGGKLYCSLDEAEEITRRAIATYQEVLP